MKIKQLFFILILSLGCLFVCYKAILAYYEASWNGKMLKYPEQVLGGPAVYDPKHFLDLKNKERLETILHDHWTKHNCVLYVYIGDSYIDSFKVSSWMDKIPYRRSEAILFLWEKNKQQWISATLKLKKETGMKRQTFFPGICSLISEGEIKEGEIFDLTWMHAQIAKVLIEQQKINNRKQYRGTLDKKML